MGVSPVAVRHREIRVPLKHAVSIFPDDPQYPNNINHLHIQALDSHTNPEFRSFPGPVADVRRYFLTRPLEPSILSVRRGQVDHTRQEGETSYLDVWHASMDHNDAADRPSPPGGRSQCSSRLAGRRV